MDSGRDFLADLKEDTLGMNEQTFNAISDSLVDAIRESINGVLVAAGLPADWQFEGDMSLTLCEVANEALVWVGGAAVDMPAVAMVAA